MAVQSPPFALQNGSHSAALFRQAAYSPFVSGGVMASGDYAVTAQSTPNLSVQVAAGRAWIPGSQVANVSGGSFSTQAAYFGINDAPATLTIATANATNPRIDTVYVAVQDSFYSGTNNVTVLGVVTGSPAASPTAPAAPSNAVVVATVAVAANATSITNSNISQQGVTTLLATTLGGIRPVANGSATPGTYVGQYRDNATRGQERWDGTQWTTPNPFYVWTELVHNSSYSYTVPIGSSFADINSGGWTSSNLPPGREIEYEFKAPECAVPAGSNLFLQMTLNGTTVDSIMYSTGGAPVFGPGRLTGSIVVPANGQVIVHVQAYASSNTVPLSSGTGGGGAAVILRYRVR